MIKTPNKRLIAIHLPQYHPIKENDEWWGEGFTEWTNVASAQPRFKGHYQPHLPADMGFYDLRLPEVREKQAQLAKEYGIYGFCYYHYWFNGKKLLERPVEEILKEGKPDFPFMLCWANENWTRIWDGGSNEVLIQQHYSPDDDIAHIKHLLPFFKDHRYIRIDSKPVFAIYATQSIPNVERTIKIWREEAAKEGLELYICRMESYSTFGVQYMVHGIDAAIEFQPFGRIRPEFMLISMRDRIISSFKRRLFGNKATTLSYDRFVDFAIKQPMEYTYKLYPGACPMWDNSARRKKGYFLFKDSNPQTYKKWLSATLAKFEPYSLEENFVFINAWNEWAEGNHLEPCKKWGRRYLEATKEALEKSYE